MISSVLAIKAAVESKLSKDLHRVVKLIIDESKNSTFGHAEQRIIERFFNEEKNAMDTDTAVSVIKSGLKQVLNDKFVGDNEESKKFVAFNGIDYVLAFVKKSSNVAVLKTCYPIGR